MVSKEEEGHIKGRQFISKLNSAAEIVEKMKILAV